ncbi:hypothetical protein NADE_003538 [Nannochloris sp. 'desiccata']|nr:hypothetical protein KSW81_000436 [Chlorella desiccata (nom. nud.)]KAH7620929.1 hypothetical protein NADE_003538 [Chlorella desiccata (nom. nud.)]
MRYMTSTYAYSSQNTSPTSLLKNFCVHGDRVATGWSHLTERECMHQFSVIQKLALQAIRTNSSNAMLLFKHVHKAGGTTLCQVATKNMIVEDVPLPFRSDWTTNCVPFESFLGPHPAVGGGSMSTRNTINLLSKSTAPELSQHSSRHLLGTWLGGACFLGFLTPHQFSVLPRHYRPLTFVASEGAFPNVMPLDVSLAMVTMLRNPLDRVLSSYRWWQFMSKAMPHSPSECRAYWAPPNATFNQWLDWYPDNWMTRELAGNEALYRKDAQGRPGPLTAADVLKAKQRLHYFAAILIMERPEESQVLLKNVFGWRDVDLDGHRAGSVRNSSAAEEVAAQTPKVFQQLQAMNKYDIEIYNYAVELHKAQVDNVQQ